MVVTTSYRDNDGNGSIGGNSDNNYGGDDSNDDNKTYHYQIGKSVCFLN